MKKYAPTYALLIIIAFCISCKGQNKAEAPIRNVEPKIESIISTQGPKSITRTIKQGRNGNIWIAAFDGVFRYGPSADGSGEKSFTNITSKVSSDRFFSILEDSKGKFWFGSIGSGVYYYDPSAEQEGGQSFQNFTTKEGLVSNEVVSIYEDSKGYIWFGANGGLSRYDPSAEGTNGKPFRNFIMDGDSTYEDNTRKPALDFPLKENVPRTVYEVNSIIEDQTGKFWFGTRGAALVYDGKTFTKLIHNDKPFTNVRWIIEDKRGNIWLGGNDGLWRFDGSTFTNITKDFVGYIYEDRQGNIWTSSQKAVYGRWVLSRYDEKSLTNTALTATEIKSEFADQRGMIFGIAEVNDGSIWFGMLNGVYRYDGNTITHFQDD